jgi:hypothetical protein
MELLEVITNANFTSIYGRSVPRLYHPDYSSKCGRHDHGNRVWLNFGWRSCDYELSRYGKYYNGYWGFVYHWHIHN